MLTLTRSDAVDPADPHADLMTPAGSTIRLTADADLRRQFDRLGIAGAHTRPRNQLVSEYAAMAATRYAIMMLRFASTKALYDKFRGPIEYPKMKYV